MVIRISGSETYMATPTITKLNFRKIDIKLMIAYMATAGKKLKPADPGVMTALDPAEFGYHNMWQDIHSYADKQGLNDMSDRAVKKLYLERLATDKQLRKTVDLWEEYGWNEHEHVQHERNSTATRWGLRGAFIGLALLGIQMPDGEA